MLLTLCGPVMPYGDIDSKIARFMGPTRGPSGADRTQVGPMLAPWILLFVFGSTLSQLMVCCQTAPSHYLTNVDISLMKFCAIHLRIIAQWVPNLLLCIMSLDIILLMLPQQMNQPSLLRIFLASYNKGYTGATLTSGFTAHLPCW